jgi:hypothetical protein
MSSYATFVILIFSAGILVVIVLAKIVWSIECWFYYWNQRRIWRKYIHCTEKER